MNNYYLALKPVRFDKDYAIGEFIPHKVIEPQNVKRLLDWGKIAYIDEPDLAPEGEFWHPNLVQPEEPWES